MLVRARDGWKCTRCPTTNNESLERWGKCLDVHRRVPGSLYTVEGCVTLCRDCHTVTHAELPRDGRTGTIARGNQTPLTSFRLSPRLMAQIRELAAWEAEESDGRPNNTRAIVGIIARAHAALKPA